jgi:hypothetical protein
MIQEPNMEDTRPQPAVRDRPETPRKTVEMTQGVVYGGVDEGRRGGCGLSALLLGGFALLALLIVVLASTAGFVSGQREGAGYATATQQSVIIDQINRIPQDVTSRNLALLNARLQFLATLTPGVPEVAQFSLTATALADELRATPTPTASATPTVASTGAAPAPTSTTPESLATLPPESAFDTEALLAQAQTAVDSGQWQDAIALLDAISGIDADFQTTAVRNLLSRALNSYAALLYNSYAPGNPGRLAEAIVLTDRAEQIGPLADGLAFERNAAQLYLDARRAIGLDPFTAIRAFQRLYDQGGQGRYFAEAQQELFNQYVALGDTQAQIGEHCPAVGYYQSALNYLSSGSVSTRLRTSSDICAVATPVPLPGTNSAPLNLTPIAPIGVPGT